MPDIIRFTGAGDHYRGEMIYHVGVGPIGKVDDYAIFSAGSYVLSISAPNDFELSILLNVDVDDINIELSKHRIYDEGCIRELKTEWDGPIRKSKRDTTLGTVWDVTLPRIKVVATTDVTTCASSFAISSGSCTRHSYAISIDTEPKNAEVWIDNRKLEYRTPAMNLRGTYCDHQNTLRLLTRLDGRVNCVETYSLHPNVEISFFCNMVKIGHD